MSRLLFNLFIKGGDPSDPGVRKKYGNLSSFTGMVCNLFLFAAKFVLGYFSGSIAITADAFNNLSDIGSNIVTFLGFKMASQPADDDHPFGHGRFEYLSGSVIALFVIMVGIEIVKTSVDKILNPSPVTFSWVVIVGLVASIAVKMWMATFYKSVSLKIDSTAMLAAAEDSKSDCLSTGATALGMMISHFFSLNLDGYLGLLVGILILYNGYKILRETINPLLGGAPDPKLVAQITETLNAYPVCIGIHDLIIHDYGPGRLMGSVHMEISADENLLKAHDQIDNAEREIREKLGVPFVIHMDPVVIDSEEILRFKTIVEDILHSIDEQFSYHDFRMVDGETHSNLIFDVVVPYGYKGKYSSIKSIIDSALRASGKPVFSVISFERSFTGM